MSALKIIKRTNSPPWPFVGWAQFMSGLRVPPALNGLRLRKSSWQTQLSWPPSHLQWLMGGRQRGEAQRGSDGKENCDWDSGSQGEMRALAKALSYAEQEGRENVV